jgi:hypothetical protein
MTISDLERPDLIASVRVDDRDLMVALTDGRTLTVPLWVSAPAARHAGPARAFRDRPLRRPLAGDRRGHRTRRPTPQRQSPRRNAAGRSAPTTGQLRKAILLEVVYWSPYVPLMKWKNRNLRAFADIVCGNVEHFPYRSSSYITEFFEDCDLEYVHDGSTRWAWVASRLEDVLALPHSGPSVPPDAFVRIVRRLLDKGEADEGDEDRGKALAALNVVLAREGWEAFYDEQGMGQLRHIATNTVAQVANPHRPLTSSELERKDQLIGYLDKCSEDELIGEVLLPLFRQLGFHRVTAPGHKDKALEYGKDVWMKFTLPTLHVLYFGIQAKKGKLDAAGTSKSGASNVGEMLNQVTMMLGHEIFDPETNRRVLVDHAFIVAAGEITKQAKNWLGERLDATKRSQVMFMDRDDILNLFIVTSLPLPKGALPPAKAWDDLDDDIPF